MSTDGSRQRVVDLDRLRRSCMECSLRTLCLPAGINREEVAELDDMVRARLPLERGEALFHAGERFENLYVVRSGTIRTAQAGRDGEEQVLGFHVPGELVGLEAICDQHHPCTAIALERTSVCAIPFARLEQVAARLPSLQRHFNRLVSRELSQDQQHVMALGRRTARERLALFLEGLSARLAATGHDGTDFRLAMSREDIANYLGLALETVSRLLTRFDDEGIVAVDRRRVRILDRQRLGEVAGVSGSGRGDSPGCTAAP